MQKVEGSSPFIRSSEAWLLVTRSAQAGRTKAVIRAGPSACLCSGAGYGQQDQFGGLVH